VELALSILIPLVILVAAIGSGVRGGAKRRDALGELAARLSGTSESNTATGTCRGVKVTYRFETRGSGSNSESWTEIDAEVSAKYPLAIHVRRHGRSDWSRIERGEMVDVIIGDAAFDAAFLLEVAPADVARLLLDQQARTFLSEHDPVELQTMTLADRKVLRFAIRTWCEDPTLAFALIDNVTRIVSRIRDAYSEADAVTQPREAGSPYRPQLDAAPIRDAAAAREREVADLEVLRATRPNGGGGMIVTIIIIAFSVIWVLAH
jgi:hypothetical protein